MAVMENRAVTSLDVVDATLTAADLAANSVDTVEIVDNAVTIAKMADNSVDTLELVNDAVTTAKIVDLATTGAKISSDARRKTVMWQMEDLAAGADLVASVIFVTSAGGTTTFIRARIIFEEVTAAVAGGNELTIALTGSAGVLGTTGALAANQAAGSIIDLALGNATVAANSNVTIDVTQAGAADAGRTTIVLEYEVVT